MGSKQFQSCIRKFETKFKVTQKAEIVYNPAYNISKIPEKRDQDVKKIKIPFKILSLSNTLLQFYGIFSKMCLQWSIMYCFPILAQFPNIKAIVITCLAFYHFLRAP
jgi:hypothetical protein